MKQLTEQLKLELDELVRSYFMEGQDSTTNEILIRQKAREYKEKTGKEYYYSLARYDGR